MHKSSGEGVEYLFMELASAPSKEGAQVPARSGFKLLFMHTLLPDLSSVVVLLFLSHFQKLKRERERGGRVENERKTCGQSTRHSPPAGDCEW